MRSSVNFILLVEAFRAFCQALGSWGVFVKIKLSQHDMNTEQCG